MSLIWESNPRKMEVNLQHSQGRLMNLEENNSLKTAYSNKDALYKDELSRNSLESCQIGLV